MKKVVSVFVLLAVIIGFSTIHIYRTTALCNEITKLTDTIYDDYYKENWDEIEKNLEQVEEIWKKHRLWACSTISTKQIDEIEISLGQSIEYSKIGAKENFIGEFRMFCLLIEHLPMQEGPSIYELL